MGYGILKIPQQTWLGIVMFTRLETKKMGRIHLEFVFFLRNNLVSWFNRKLNYISLFTVEADYIAIGSGCTQLSWIKNVLKDYGILEEVLTL